MDFDHKSYRYYLAKLRRKFEQPVAAVADEQVPEELELMKETTQSESTRHCGWWSWLSRLRPDSLITEPL